MLTALEVLKNMNNIQLSDKKILNSCDKEVFQVANSTFLKRFMFLGAENGTLYINKEDLMKQHVNCLESMIKNEEFHNELLAIVDEYITKSFKKDYILFVLARCCVEKKYSLLRSEAYKMVLEICKIPTYLFLFIEFYEFLSKKHNNSTGWNAMQKNFVKDWYLSKDPNNLVYLVTKYRNRNNWTHKDVLKLGHIKSSNTIYDYIFKYITTDYDGFKKKQLENTSSNIKTPEDLDLIDQYLQNYEKISQSTDISEITQLIEEHNFVREHLSTTILDDIDIWRALCKNMPFTALLRNINKITKIGLFEEYPETLVTLINKLNSKEAITKSRVHPLQILIAIKMYSSGKGLKGDLTWEPNKELCTSLNNAFKLSFDNVRSTSKRYNLALDCSGSMEFNKVCGIDCLSPRELSIAFSMILKNVEDNCEINGFSTKFVPLNTISPHFSLEKNIDIVSNLPFAHTDCSIPFTNAIKYNKQVDVFIIITDNETNCNSIEPSEALKRYREHSGINAKLVVVAMASNEFSIADSDDPYMLDIVGFSESTFDAIQEFSML
jgi:60 kDa SS-A/Ro ribonucleoprotein